MAVSQTNSTISTSSAVIFAATNGRRTRGLIIQNNDSANDLYINLAGATATTSDFYLAAGEAMPVPFDVTNNITAIAGGIDTNYSIAFA